MPSTSAPTADRRSALANGLLGRAQELAELEELLERCRLVTVTGAPGVGKTRLVQEFAARYPGPARFVDLAAVGDGAGVTAAVAFALSLHEIPGSKLIEGVMARLRRERSVLVLDNCEHLIPACRELAGGLVRECPELSIVATSREPLALEEETTWPLLPLAVPGRGEPAVPEVLIEYPSVRLFVEGAAAAQPGFVLSSYVAPAVAEICRRLDGIPLAIELAAARVDMLTPRELAARLDDRFDLLGRGGAVGRHETLQGALDWSYELLSDRERCLLRRLSVFVGGFDLPAVESVCAGAGVARSGTATLVATLASKSLVAFESAPGVDRRYRLLETVRAYASDRLEETGEVPPVREAHASFYVGLAEALEPELTGRGQVQALGRLDSERANLRRALEWCLGHARSDWALRLAAALVLFWRVRSRFSEGREMLEAALSSGRDAAPGIRAKALWGAGFLTLMAGDADDAMPGLASSLRIFRELNDLQGVGRALLILANCNWHRNRTGVPLLLEESAARARRAGDHWCLAHALAVAGFNAEARGEFRIARGKFEESLAVARKGQDKQGLRFGLIGLGTVAVHQGDYPSAQDLLEEGLSIASELDEDYSKAEALNRLALLALGRGEYARARELLEEALALTPEIAPPSTVACLILILGRVAHAAGDRAGAQTRFDEALTRSGSTLQLARVWRADLALDGGDHQHAGLLLGVALEHARTSGACSHLADALHGLGRVATADGDLQQAQALHAEALGLHRQNGAAPAMVASIEALAGVAALVGDHGHAAKLLGAAATVRRTRGYARMRWEADSYRDGFTLARAGLGVVDFDRAFADGGTLSVEDAAALACRKPDVRGRPASGWDSLTVRERQVAELAAAGMTNPEIAERLVISRATVKNHLLHVFTKLGVTRRSELARKAPGQTPPATSALPIEQPASSSDSTKDEPRGSFSQ